MESNSPSANRKREAKLRSNQKSQANQKDEAEENQFEVEQLRAKLSGTIAEIKADPQLVNKFRAQCHSIPSTRLLVAAEAAK